MTKFDFFIDELCVASIEAKDKDDNRRIDKDSIKMVNSKLEILLGNNIDNIICSIRSAFLGIEDYIYTLWYERSSDNLISNIETNLMNCIGLKPEFLTGCIKNSDLLAYVYYGICIINIIKNRDYTAERYLMKMFIMSPEIAKKDLAPKVFDTYFKPKLEDFYKHRYRIIQDDPRTYTSGIVPYLMIEYYENQILEQREAIEESINAQCRIIAKERLKELEFGNYKPCF